MGASPQPIVLLFSHRKRHNSNAVTKASIRFSAEEE
ncbi:MAG: hypothetical protein RL318_1605 [Fibrobacterota bacterium]|jgi:hypothetical protein